MIGALQIAAGLALMAVSFLLATRRYRLYLAGAADPSFALPVFHPKIAVTSYYFTDPAAGSADIWLKARDWLLLITGAVLTLGAL